ncbi:F-box/kelch-repeat protein At3g06240-like [Papaver somniferum]|uniref:F-box/kelch-repeat protein At3g06240-like n=1 Tax=Papaver somniferum TaxID=3469 RepID=UPI000E6F47DF|nr:F-box/kelch-repeat protein At3g06240-like [Papaver somniferum]
MSSIPEEMYHEILLRLPVKSLLVCKSVCKNWYALISSSDFVNTHITMQKNNPSLMLDGLAKFSGNNILHSISYDSVYEIKDDRMEMDIPFKSSVDDVQLLGSCNGLVCIWLFDHEGHRDCICLWNPGTREYKVIPKSPSVFYSCDVCAFGYDRRTDGYKLAIGITACGTKDSSLVQVYTLSSNSWTKGQLVPYKFPSTYKSGVLVNGDLHWLAIAQDNIILLSLDIGEESFKELQLPVEKDQHPRMILGELEGCLCILVSSYGVKTHVEIWKMLDYGVRESWTKYHVISHETIVAHQFLLRLIRSFKNGEILFLCCDILVLYDLKNGSVSGELF